MTTKFFGLKDIKTFAFQSPWGDSGNMGQGNKPNEEASFKPKNQQPNNQRPNFKPKNSESFSKKFEKFFKNNFGGGSGGNGGGKNIFDRSKDKTPKSIIGLIVLALVFLWLSSGVYKVDSDENAVVLYFGKFYSVETPGLNYHIPFPFGQVIKKKVTTVNTEEFGFVSNSKDNSRNLEAESLMLTGDENIVDIEFQVQWQISDIKNFVFNIAEPNQAIRKTAESAMREIIARTPIVDALSDGKKNIESQTKDLLQQVLDQYGAGVRIVLVQLRRVDPPLKVIDAFRDVQTAKADKEKEINQAQAYANDIIPRARGMAAEMEQQAQAFSQEVVANAKGEAGRFVAIYNQYTKAKQVTKKRMYLETMEKIYRDMDKVFIDKNTAKSGVVPYFPLNDITKPAPTKQNQ
ncbi:MAG: FtsH protease activity modulator HflK [Rickettsiales bacterium]|nr:FtsH protease activity modulator HflK [Rickettsiales bacterium]